MCGAYTGGRPLNECWSAEAPPWAVPTPNMDRLAARGTTFDNCWTGSTPCMPARRDIYTGRYEFLERGWGPLEEDDLDLPRQVSGPPNQSVQWTVENGYRVSYLLTDHFHLWEQGAGNYHMGYTGFDFVRGCEADAFRTDPVAFACPEGDRLSKNERHWRNVHFIRQPEEDYFCAQVFRRAIDWLEGNRAHKDFYLQPGHLRPARAVGPAGRDPQAVRPAGLRRPRRVRGRALHPLARAADRRAVQRVSRALRGQGRLPGSLAGALPGRAGSARPVAGHGRHLHHRPRHLQRRPRPHRQAANPRARRQGAHPVHRGAPDATATASAAHSSSNSSTSTRRCWPRSAGPCRKRLPADRCTA